ncbi:MAG: hypothetical protein HQL36_03790 [Alphaproteobacteria bacterium]|nr:hypothetical protein [Alphaproteobacteria bacterium]MBF0249037.1 hypothetical protein [Alphaproteobacteria bacterium]
MATRNPGDHPETRLGEVLFEFRRVGKVLRVCAIDPRTGVEVTMVADPRQGPETIKRVAARKLAYVLNKKRENGEIR